MDLQREWQLVTVATLCNNSGKYDRKGVSKTKLFSSINKT